MSHSDHTMPAVMPHRGALILVFGILGLLVCLVFGIISWIMGKGDLDRMKAGQMDPEGESLTKVGMILGIVACCLQILAVVMSILLFGVFGVAAGMSAN